jgi:class 3 adenylate cyclase
MITGLLFCRLFYFQVTMQPVKELSKEVTQNLLYQPFLPYISKFGLLEITNPNIIGIELIIFLLPFLYLFFWFRPVHKVLKKGREKSIRTDQERAQRRVISLTKRFYWVGWGTVILFCINHIYWEFGWPLPTDYVLWLKVLVPYMVFGVIAASAISIIGDQHVIYISPLVFPEWKSTEEKYQGKQITIDTKLVLMLVTSSIIPLVYMFLLVGSDPIIVQATKMKNFTEFWSFLNTNFEEAFPLYTAIVLLCFSLLNTVVGGYSMRRTITRPLKFLVTKINKVKEGDWDQYTSVWSGDEIGQLKSAYNQMLDSLQRSEKVEQRLSQFVSKEVSEKILKQDKIRLGGQNMHCSILFTDIRDFTSLSEKMDAHEVVEMLNSLFSHLVEPIERNGGFVNKYMGDCIMALFGVPMETKSHADQAVKSGLELRKALTNFNFERRIKGLPTINIGIGIHTGKVVAGNIGSQNRMEYTVIGDSVNVASRIESQTKELKTDLLVSKETLRNVSPDFRKMLNFERCSGIMVKGKSKPVDLFKIAYFG